MNIFFPIFFFLIFGMAYPQDKDDRLEKLNWIADRWVCTDSQGVTYENWVKEADDSFTGEAYTLKNGNRVFSEHLKIEKTDDEIFFTAIVEHNPEPVKFKLKELGYNKAVFENPENDFPNRIIYKLKNSDSLYARIEGKNKEGKNITGEFFYTRAR